jgi:PTH2 family peptidyl-tRNA hydrolase
VSDVKQVIVIRRDLKMRRGKEIAQGAHASMAWLTSRLRERFRELPSEVGGGAMAMAEFSNVEWQWISGNFRKITVTVNSEEELWEIHDKARAAGITSVMVTDAGLTEFSGNPTLTALAVGPDFDEKIDPITGHLALY